MPNILCVIFRDVFAFELEPVSGNGGENIVEDNLLLFLGNLSLNLWVDVFG